MAQIKITAHDGGTFNAYIARPENKTAAPVIIVIQEIFGVNKELRDKCDALAADGYIAICPDLFWRIEPGIELTDSIEEQLHRAFQLFGEFNAEQGMKDLQSTLTRARELDGGSGPVGCIGYCLGGRLAYMMATQTDIDASVSYYGVMIETMLEQGKSVRKPLMLHIAEEDQFVPKAAQAQIKNALAGNPKITIHTYPGAEHAFARGQGMHYDAKSAKLANERTAEFLKENLV